MAVGISGPHLFCTLTFRLWLFLKKDISRSQTKNYVYSLFTNISHPCSEGINSGKGKMVPFG